MKPRVLQSIDSLYAAGSERQAAQLAQSLNVLVGPKGGSQAVVGGNIAPAGPKYAQSTVTFSVKTAGSYTITFQGLQPGDSTVLLDAVTCVLSNK